MIGCVRLLDTLHTSQGILTENMALRLSDFLPSKFNGDKNQNPRSHFLSYNDYLQIHNIRDGDMQIARFKHTLSGPARVWFENKDFDDLDDLKNRFTRYFSGVHSREANARQFRTLVYKTGENVEEYLTRIRTSANQLGYDDNLIRDQFVAGLPHTVQIQLSMSGRNDLQELVDMAQRYMDLTTNVGKVTFNDNPNNPYAFQSEQVSTQMEKLTEQMASLARVTAERFENVERGRMRSRYNRSRENSSSRSPYKTLTANS